MKKIIPFLFLVILLGCGRPHSNFLVIDQELVPAQLVELDPKIQIEGKFVNIETKETIVKKVNVSDYQGWYFVHPETFRKLVLSGMTPKSKTIIMSPESDPFVITENNKDGEMTLRLVSVESQEEVVKKVKIKDYIRWVIVHPHMYKRLLQAGMPNK